jgi:hypothetical protein
MMTKRIKATLVSALWLTLAACGSSSDGGKHDGSRPGVEAGEDETGGKAPIRGGSGVDGPLLQEDAPTMVMDSAMGEVAAPATDVSPLDGSVADAPMTKPDAPAGVDAGIDSPRAEVGLPTFTLTATLTRTRTILPTGTLTATSTSTETLTGTGTTTATSTATFLPTVSFTNTRTLTTLPTGSLTGIITKTETMTDTSTATVTITGLPTVTFTNTRTLIDPTFPITNTRTLIGS